jgi:radical SAM superfamily enzyme YgiQ (UPF0313 family)
MNTNMKILLIYPYCLENRLHEEDAGVVPMGLYYIGALLKENGYDVDILNFHGLGKDQNKIKEILKEKQADVIGFSVLNANRWGAIDIAKIAKTLNPKVKIVFGGVAATFLWKHFLLHFKEVDVVVIGEGEYSLSGQSKQKTTLNRSKESHSEKEKKLSKPRIRRRFTTLMLFPFLQNTSPISILL